RLIAAAKERAPAYRRLFADLDPAEIRDRAALARLPLTRKSALLDEQRRDPPFGGFAAAPVSALSRIFASPGPLYEPEAPRPDFWRLGRALYAAGFRAGDLVHNAFSYHLTPAGAMVESAARALGCPVVPAGTGQSELQLRTIADLKPVGYAGTPSFLKVLFDRAAALGAEISSLKKALVGAEPLPETLRAELTGHGLTVLQCYGSADIGLIAYETMDEDGALCEGMVVDEGLILELVAPGTGDPVGEGEIGEVVVTTLTPEYPLIRFATGDLSALLPGPSRCGRTNRRLRGWLGRADQSVKVRGLFVHPAQIAEILRRHPAIGRFRLVVERPAAGDEMTLYVEPAPGANLGADDPARIAETLQALTKLRGTVRPVPPGSLPEDARVIEDRRKFD
ncbi:MAG TPA: AMP-binding protein, partial [Stellaceae bacterium]|nr:AMP-binding protein [Stellaceae bacterium]